MSLGSSCCDICGTDTGLSPCTEECITYCLECFSDYCKENPDD